MEVVTNEALKAGGSWLTKERQKFEIFTEEKIGSFSADCQRETDWLRNYLQNIIQATNVKISKKKEISNQVAVNNETSETSHQVTVNNKISETASICNNVGISTSASQQTRRLIIKHTPRSKHEKPEIKSLILAAAAAKREQEKQEKRFIKAKEREIARQRAKGKNTDLVGRKKLNQIQENSEKQPEISEQNKIPFNIQLIEQPKQLGGKIHEKTLHTDKQSVLPEVDSDNSSDEEKVKTKHQRRNDWEQSPELKAALICQASIDPETIFGIVPPLNVDEIFRGREYRFRLRSSSADWTGLDALTEEEELEYKVRMGFYN